MSKRNFVIIAAGGTGTRVGANLPKQFLLLNGKPVLMYSIINFHLAITPVDIILVLAEEMKSFWQQLCEEHSFRIPHKIIYSGDTRFQSIKNGVQYIEKNYKNEAHNISIHDGARPLVSIDMIDKSFSECDIYESSICAVKSVNSVRMGQANKNSSCNRDEVWLIQTPQVFRANILFDAYRQEEDTLFTDDASVVEKLGNNIRLTEGDPKNIKITYPEDIAIAQLLLNNKKD